MPISIVLLLQIEEQGSLYGPGVLEVSQCF